MNLKELLAHYSSKAKTDEEKATIENDFKEAIANMDNLTANLQSEKDKVDNANKDVLDIQKTLDGRMATLGKFGLDKEFKDEDVDKIIATLNSTKTPEDIRNHTAEAIKEAITNRDAEHQEALKIVIGEKDKYKSNYETNVVENSLLKSMTKHKIDPKNQKYIAMDIANAGLSFNPRGEIEFLDSGKKLILDNNGDPINVDGVFDKLVKDGKFDAFVPSTAPNNGMQHNGGGKPTNDMSAFEKIEAGLANK
jgi:hypothetical protein